MYSRYSILRKVSSKLSTLKRKKKEPVSEQQTSLLAHDIVEEDLSANINHSEASNNNNTLYNPDYVSEDED
jgi:hypothetical protein